MPLFHSLRGNEASVTQQLVSNRILHFHCIAIDCGRLQNPPFGRVDLAGTVINARATYACIPGYVLIGNKFQICLINGRWSGETPVCRLGESLSLILEGPVTVLNDVGQLDSCLKKSMEIYLPERLSLKFLAMTVSVKKYIYPIVLIRSFVYSIFTHPV